MVISSFQRPETFIEISPAPVVYCIYRRRIASIKKDIMCRLILDIHLCAAPCNVQVTCHIVPRMTVRAVDILCEIVFKPYVPVAGRKIRTVPVADTSRSAVSRRVGDVIDYVLVALQTKLWVSITAAVLYPLHGMASCKRGLGRKYIDDRHYDHEGQQYYRRPVSRFFHAHFLQSHNLCIVIDIYVMYRDCPGGSSGSCGRTCNLSRMSCYKLPLLHCISLHCGRPCSLLRLRPRWSS